MYSTLTGTTNPGQSGPGSNGNERVLVTMSWLYSASAHCIVFIAQSLKWCHKNKVKKKVKHKAWMTGLSQMEGCVLLWTCLWLFFLCLHIWHEFYFVRSKQITLGASSNWAHLTSRFLWSTICRPRATHRLNMKILPRLYISRTP